MSIIFYFLQNFRYTLTIKTKKRSAARGGNDMFRIWAKIMKEGKIQRQFVYENDEEKLTYSHFLQYLFDICCSTCSTSAASSTRPRPCC